MHQRANQEGRTRSRRILDDSGEWALQLSSQSSDYICGFFLLYIAVCSELLE